MTKYYIPEFDDPFPEGRVAITGFRHETALVLLRLTEGADMEPNVRQWFNGDREAKYVVAGSYTVHWEGARGETGTIIVPRGMMTDLTSVPPVFRGLVNRVGPWLEAAIVHDFLCIAWRTMDGQGTRKRRDFADAIMWAAMEKAEVGATKYLIWGAIRAAAWLSWPKRSDPSVPPDLYLDLDDALVQGQLPKDVKLVPAS